MARERVFKQARSEQGKAVLDMVDQLRAVGCDEETIKGYVEQYWQKVVSTTFGGRG